MKSKKMSFFILCAMVALAFVIVPVSANAFDLAQGRIYRIGYDPRFEGAMVQLEDASDTPAWEGYRSFYLSSTLGNQGLAVALTAYSMGATVWVRISGGAAPGSLISIIHINAATQ